MVGGCAGGDDGAAEGTLARWRRAAAKRIGLSCASFFTSATAPSSPSSKTVRALLFLHSLPSCFQGLEGSSCSWRKEKGSKKSLIFAALFTIPSDLLCFLCSVCKKTRFHVYCFCKFLVKCSCVVKRNSGLHFIGWS
jgi:hypothetical protein